MDFKTAFEKAGVKFHEIYATLSTNKNAEIRAALAGDYKPMTANILDPLNKVFIKSIKANREGKLDSENEQVFSGTTFHSKEALKAGLVDEIGNFDYALRRASELSHKENSKLNTAMKINLKSSMKGLLAFFNAKVEDGKESVEKEITQEDLTNLDAKVARADELEADNKTLKEAKEKAETELATANSKVSQLGADNKTLKEGKEKAEADLKTEQENLATATAKIEELSGDVAEQPKKTAGTEQVSNKKHDLGKGSLLEIAQFSFETHYLDDKEVAEQEG